MLIVAARMPGRSGGTAAGARTEPISPNPRPHAASAHAAQPAVAAGRNPNAISPPASATPPTATAARGARSGTSHLTAIVAIGSDVTTSAPAIGDQPQTTTSSNTDRNSAPTNAPYNARKPALASAVRERTSGRGAASTERTRGSTTAMSASAASGACSKKMLRQLKSSVRNPPSAGPTATPIVPARPQSRIACSSLPRIPANTGIAPTSASAAPSPWTVRLVMRTSKEVASPHDKDATANTPRPSPASTCPRARLANQSTPSAPTTIARLYAVIVHETVTIETSNAP